MIGTILIIIGLMWLAFCAGMEIKRQRKQKKRKEMYMDKTILMYLGRDVETLSKEELIEAIRELFDMYESQRKNYQKERELFRIG